MHFVASAVIVRHDKQAPARAELAQLRADLGRQPRQVLHFQKFSHAQRLKAIQGLAASSVDTIANVIMCKGGFTQPDAKTGELSYITNPDPMYLYPVRLLMERVSWYIRENGGGSAVVTFAHVRRFKADKLHDYRAALKASNTNIHWPSFDGHPFKIGAPDQVGMLRFADTAASSGFRAIEPDEFGNTERRYLTELAPKLYRRGAANVVSYGLKTFPATYTNAGGTLDWLREL